MVFVRADILVDFSELELVGDFFETFPELATEKIYDVWTNELEPNILPELQYTPGPALTGLNSSEPFRWSVDPEADERARRYVFANNLQGRERTGNLRESYQVDITVGDGLIVMSVRNTADYWKFVVGKRQIPGHERTGWPLDSITINYWARVSREVITDAVVGLVTGKEFVR